MKRKLSAQNTLGIKIRDIMTREIATIGPEMTVQEAAQVMRDRDVGMLPVLSRGRLLGLVTDRDMVVRAVADGLDLKSIRVREIMTTVISYCYDTEDVAQAVKTMEMKQIRRLLILNRTRKLVGVLSIGDVAVDTGDQQLAGEVLRKVSEPDHSVVM